MGKKSVLIATLGTEVQVVTSVFNLLTKLGEVISRIEVIHTTSPNPLINSAIDILETEFNVTDYHGKTSLALIPMKTSEGYPVEDATTPEETQAVFRCLYNTVKENKKSGYKIHLSIAGGRKTMAVFGMLAAQLLFEDDDSLWHLYSGGEFLSSKRLYPEPGDDVHLIPIPVVQWSNVAPILLDFSEIDDPLEALILQEDLRIKERLEDMRSFVLGALSPAEERVVGLLVKSGLSDNELAEALSLSPRTVEQHLRSAYRKASDHWSLPDVGRSQLISLLNLLYSTQITGNPA
jgi:CRISPR-associated Csx14 family protein